MKPRPRGRTNDSVQLAAPRVPEAIPARSDADLGLRTPSRAATHNEGVRARPTAALPRPLTYSVPAAARAHARFTNVLENTRARARWEWRKPRPA